MDRGDVKYAVTGETTEWEDILIKKGIKTKEDVLIEKGIDPQKYAERERLKNQKIEYKQEPTLEEKLEGASTLDDLSDLEDEYDDDRILQQFREKRLAEMKERASKNIFGEVCEISREDWVREVTEASEDNPVVIHLFQDYVAECEAVDTAFRHLARDHGQVKFVRIKSTSAIENWKDSLLPTIFVYEKGALKHQLLGIKELGGQRMAPENLEWKLSELGILESQLEEEPDIHIDTKSKIHGGIITGSIVGRKNWTSEHIAAAGINRNGPRDSQIQNDDEDY